MLRQAKDLEGYKLSARDGEIGSVEEFYGSCPESVMALQVFESGRDVC